MKTTTRLVGLLLGLMMYVAVAKGTDEGVPIPVDEDLAPPLPLDAAPEGLDFFQAFFKSVAVIVVTELGDKTFFIAAVRFVLFIFIIILFN